MTEHCSSFGGTEITVTLAGHPVPSTAIIGVEVGCRKCEDASRVDAHTLTCTLAKGRGRDKAVVVEIDGASVVGKSLEIDGASDVGGEPVVVNPLVGLSTGGPP